MSDNPRETVADWVAKTEAAIRRTRDATRHAQQVQEGVVDPTPSREGLRAGLHWVNEAAREYAARCQMSTAAYWKHGPGSEEDRQASNEALQASYALVEAVADLDRLIGRLP